MLIAIIEAECQEHKEVWLRTRGGIVTCKQIPPHPRILCPLNSPRHELFGGAWGMDVQMHRCTAQAQQSIVVLLLRKDDTYQQEGESMC